MGRASNAKERMMDAVAELIWTGSYGSTTVEQICERAGVQKGSFYHFFDSKSALAEAALQVGWEKYRSQLDTIFSPSLPPLERIHRYCAFERKYQDEMRMKYGMVLGCPYCTLGTEVSTRDERLRRKVDECMDRERKYFASAIRDAHAEGLVHAPDAVTAADAVYAYVEGLLSRARIKNSMDALKGMEKGVRALLGVRAATAA